VIPADFGVTTCRALDLAACLRCLGWAISTTFFRHDSDGHITASLGQPDAETGFDPEPDPLPATNVSLAVTPPRWRQQDWAQSNGRENLNRLGGEPTWIPMAMGQRRYRLHTVVRSLPYQRRAMAMHLTPCCTCTTPR
jgi:hypothetical protein